MPRPVIFISAAQPELQSIRFIVANTLISRGFKPKWQDASPPEDGSPGNPLRKSVEQSDAVIQIVGHTHGAPAPDGEYGAVAHTHYEALHALRKGKPVWYIILNESHPTDGEANEIPRLGRLQCDYRTKVVKQGGICHFSSTPRTTEEIVAKLCEAFSSSRRRSRQRLASIAALLLIAITGITWALLRRDEAAGTLTATPPSQAEHLVPDAQTAAETPPAADGAKEIAAASPDSPPSNLAVMEKALSGLADAEIRSRHIGEDIAGEGLRARAYALLEQEGKLPPGTLATSLPDFAREIRSSTGGSPEMKASAAYALGDFEDAEILLLQHDPSESESQENRELNPNEFISRRIRALERAAQFATARNRFDRAVDHHRSAAALASAERNPLEWARIRQKLAHSLSLAGQYNEAAENLTQVIPVYEKIQGAEHADTLASSNNLANALNTMGRHAEAEERHRAILATRLRTLGPDHPDTLNSRNNLAATLNFQRKRGEAEEQYRAVLSACERTLGEEHPDTLFTRDNLAKTLTARGNHAEAEQQYRSALAIRGKVLGEEHPDTLASRDNLAKTLRSRRKYTEAAEQSRIVLAIRERVLGTDHRDVHLSCHNLALGLANGGNKEEALPFARRALAGFSQSHGPDTPHSLAARKLVSVLERDLQVPPASEDAD